MKIYNFHVNNTYDDRLHMILTSKLLLINYFAEYGIGNPLTITENCKSPIDKFIAYFKKESNFAMSNEDFAVIKRILRKVGIKTRKYANQNEIISLLSQFKEKIVELFDEKEFEELTDEQLLIQRNKLDCKLNFPKHTNGALEIDKEAKKNIANLMQNVNFRVNLSDLIINYEEKLRNVEVTGNPMYIEEKDIVSFLPFSTDSDDNINFISDELIQILKEQGVKINEYQ